MAFIHKRMRSFIIYASCLLSLNLSFISSDAADWIGKKAPDFTLESVTEAKFYKLESYKGKIVLVDFWATWCGPCKKALSQLSELQKKYKNDVKVLAISIDDKKSSAQSFIRKYKLEIEALFDIDKKVATLYEVPAMPTLYIIDQNGFIRYVHAGYNIDHMAEITSEIEKLRKG